MDSADKVLEIVWSRRSDFDQAMSCQRLLYSAEWQAAKTQVFLQSPQLLKTLFFYFLVLSCINKHYLSSPLYIVMRNVIF